ncbi:hypothetical protein BH10BAC5_BH10BAC5_10690 [soil metagenome]
MFIFDIPTPAAFLLICSTATLLSYLVLKSVRKRINHDKLKENHEIGAIMFNAFGLLYAVFISFMVFAVWSGYQLAETNVELEVNLLNLLYSNSSALDAELKAEIKKDLTDYAEIVVTKDWEEMSEGNNTSSIIPLNKLWNTVSKIKADSVKSSAIFAEYYDNLNQLSRYRTLRILENRYNLPLILWVVLFFGAFISLSYSFFFSMNKFSIQVIFTSLLASFTFLLLFLIYSFDHPFSGSTSLKAVPFEDFLKVIKFVN